MDKIQENFKKNFNHDQSMIKFKECGTLKQYLPKNLIKKRHKVWMLADKSDYWYRFDLYTGKIGNEITKNLGNCEYLTSSSWKRAHNLFW